ncbi:MAG: hypothetical protein ACUVRK_12915 [Spirochaetota bacterium]
MDTIKQLKQQPKEQQHPETIVSQWNNFKLLESQQIYFSVGKANIKHILIKREPLIGA